jgi:hypothetical protein
VEGLVLASTADETVEKYERIGMAVFSDDRSPLNCGELPTYWTEGEERDIELV